MRGGRRLVLAIATGLCVSSAAGAAADGLAGLRWEYRPLLVFTPSRGDERLSRQTTALAEVAAGVGDRRLAVYVIAPEAVSAALGAPAPQADARELRQRFGVSGDAFRVILVGLDGGAKLTSEEPVDAETLFATIDRMPMRQRELRGRGDAGR